MLIKLVKLCILSCIFTNAHEFNTCGNNNLNVQSIHFYPDPPHIGGLLDVSLEGIARTNLINPIMEVDLSILGIPLTTLHVDICTDCPLKSGTPFTFDINYTLPDKSPGSLPIDVTLKATDQSVSIGCYSLQTNVVEHIQDSMIDDDVYWLFHHWKKQYDVQYNTIEEEVHRYGIFCNNTKYLLLHYHPTVVVGHNKYSDLDRDEYRQRLGYKYIPDWRDASHIVVYNSTLPPTVDWRTIGAVTPVKNQGQCGSCWSFSTTGAMEGAYFIKTGTLVSFSEQELVDCDHVDQGCNGGEMDDAFEWIHNNSGLCSEDSYPYSSAAGKCKKCQPVKNSRVSGYVDVAPSEEALMAAVALQPVSIAIEADHRSFQFYSSGVYSGDCGTNLDHGVLLVGYGSENGKDYWIVKNSWGDTWGNSGYIYVGRGTAQEGGECGIELSASYPIM